MLCETFVILIKHRAALHTLPHSQMAHGQICNFTMPVYKYKICGHIQIFAQSTQTDMLFVQLIAPFTAQRGVFSAHGRLDKSASYSTHSPKSNLFMHIKQCNNMNILCILLLHILTHNNNCTVSDKYREVNSQFSIYSLLICVLYIQQTIRMYHVLIWMPLVLIVMWFDTVPCVCII